MGELLLKLFNSFSPLVLQLVKDWQKANNTTEIPTMEQLVSEYQKIIDGYLAEGKAWRDAHPRK